MGSFIEINDTLQLTKEQGFPNMLSIDAHLSRPFTAQEFENTIFHFNNKEHVRIYKAPPVRNFLVENVDGKWIYWGLCHVTEEVHDMVKKTTSGKFKIIYINTPEEMREAHKLIDQNQDNNFFL